MLHLAAIIPAHNEERTVADVVRVLKNAPRIGEVIVVSDGSTDATARVAREAGAVVYERTPKQGKGSAMLFGLSKTDAPLVLFCDADLRGLTTDHVDRLLAPIDTGSRTMSIGLRDRGSLLNHLTPHLPLIGGERIMHRSVIEGVPVKYLSGYMIESALNYYCRSHGLVYGSVLLPGLSIRRKYEKVGWVMALWQYLRMACQVLKAMFSVRWARLFNRF